MPKHAVAADSNLVQITFHLHSVLWSVRCEARYVSTGFGVTSTGACGVQHVVCDMWCTSCGTHHVVHIMWCVTCAV